MNFLSMLETTDAGIADFLQLAARVKKDGDSHSQILRGKTLVMLFEKSSTRTRVSFDIVMNQLGGHAISLDFNQIQASRGESVADTARTLAAYSECIMARMYKQQDLIELEKYSNVPVINGQTDEEHPCQALADILTIKENSKLEKGRVFCYVGDATKNICSSLIVACAKAGMEVRITCPKKYSPGRKFLDAAKKLVKVKVSEKPSEAMKEADVIYTDSWTGGLGEENASDRISQLREYRLDENLLKNAAPDCIIMHPLPANRGVEITSECLDSKKSVVWQQAKNRLYMQKAILLKVLLKA